MVFNSTNQCPDSIIVCYTDSAGLSVAETATPGVSFPLGRNFTESNLTSAMIWGYPGNNASSISDCISAKLQADLAEFNISGSNNTDLYQISNVVCLPARLLVCGFLLPSECFHNGRKKTHVIMRVRLPFPSQFRTYTYANYFYIGMLTECVQFGYNDHPTRN